MGVLGESLGGKHTFEHGGKTYEVSPITQDIKLKFERHLFGKAKETAKELRDLMDRAAYADHLKKLGDDYSAGKFAFNSREGKRAMRGTGLFTLLSFMFAVSEEEMFKIAKDKPEEVVALFRVVMMESFGLTEEELTKGEEEWKARQASKKKVKKKTTASRRRPV